MGGKKQVSDLRLNPKNPRKITDKRLSQLEKSMAEYGDISCIVFNVRSGNLIGGNQRSKNLDKDSKVVITKRFEKPTKTGTVAVGYILHKGERFNYREVSWDKPKEIAAGIAANKNAGLFDEDELAEQLEYLNSFDVGADLELTMFEEDELKDLGILTTTVSEYERALPSPDGADDEEEEPEPIEEPEKLLGKVHLINSDCLKALKNFPSNSIDSIVTDPPYGFAFMGKKWDYELPSVEIWQECLRVLKPGGHLLAFGGPRTYHRLAVGIEDAGFEIRDQLQWLFGSGFPKSLDISKAIDKAAGAEREVVGREKNFGKTKLEEGKNGFGDFAGEWNVTTPTTPEAKQWDGWGTALKPANEPIVLARKPLSEDTVAKNVLKWGTGGLNIDAGRIGYKDDNDLAMAMAAGAGRSKGEYTVNWGGTVGGRNVTKASGRFPANLILDETAAEMLDEQSEGKMHSAGAKRDDTRPMGYSGKGMFPMATDGSPRFGDTGGASRFFYVAKASKSERNAHCDDLDGGRITDGRNGVADFPKQRDVAVRANHHPTVKPVSLMRYLCKLVTQPNGIVLDPFMGSGSTGVAALQAEFKFIGIERELEYFRICEKRLNASVNQTQLVRAKLKKKSPAKIR